MQSSSNPVSRAVVAKFAAYLTAKAQMLLGYVLEVCLGPGGVVATSIVAQRYRDTRQKLVVSRRDLESAGWSEYHRWKESGEGRLPAGMAPKDAVRAWVKRYAVESFWGDLLIKPQDDKDSWEIQLLSVWRIALSILRPSFNLDGDFDGSVTYYDDSVSSEEAAEDVESFFDMDDVALELYFRVESDIDSISSRSNFAEEIREEQLEEWHARLVNSTKPGIGRSLPQDDRFVDYLLGREEDSIDESFNVIMSRGKNEVSIGGVFSFQLLSEPSYYGGKRGYLDKDFLFVPKSENGMRMVGVDKTTDDADYGVFALAESATPDWYYAKERLMTILRNVRVPGFRPVNRDTEFNNSLGRPFAMVSKAYLAEFYGETRTIPYRDNSLWANCAYFGRYRSQALLQEMKECKNIVLQTSDFWRVPAPDVETPVLPYAKVETEVRFAILHKRVNKDGTKKPQDTLIAFVRSSDVPELGADAPYVGVTVLGVLRQEVLLSLGLSGRTVDNLFVKEDGERFEYAPHFPRNRRHTLRQPIDAETLARLTAIEYPEGNDVY